jgi:hypothetical protein
MGIRRQHVEDADEADPLFSVSEKIEVPGIPPV